jgi:hypothetical protein
VAGAWAATLTAFAAWWISSRVVFVDMAAGLPLAESLRFVVSGAERPEIYLPWQMIFYLTAGLVAGVVVSLFTKKVGPEKLEDFYALTRTPIQPGEELKGPCRLPDGVTPAPANNLISRWGLEIPRPSRTATIGFLVGWAFVAAIIYAMFLIAG